MFCTQRRRLFWGPLVAFCFGPCFWGASVALDFVAASWELSGPRPAASLHTVDWHGSHRPGSLTLALGALGAVAAGVTPQGPPKIDLVTNTFLDLLNNPENRGV
jgi:hypothetical protein